MVWIKVLSFLKNLLMKKLAIKNLARKNLALKNLFSLTEQQALVFLVCLPCLLVTAIALYMAQVSPYLTAFIVIILVLICLYVVVAIKNESEQQLRVLSNLIESMIEGDYSLQGRSHAQQAHQELLTLVNKLSTRLAKHRIDAEQSRLLLEKIMAQMDAMVLAVDEQGRVVMANASAKKLILGGIDVFTNFAFSSIPLGKKISTAQSGVIKFDQPLLNGEYFLLKEHFLSQGKQHQLFLLTNAERLLMEKERDSWKSLIRVLSHEMNNSLTPIAAISQAMKQKLQPKSLTTPKQLNTESFLDGVNIINERANALTNFITRYSQLSHLPKPVLARVEITPLLEELAALFPNCTINIMQSCDVCIDVDREQIPQVLINVLKNAQEAMEKCEQPSLVINYVEDQQWQHLSIKDNGVGIANSDNLFVPFFTTKQQGSGIGLALCRQIMFNHHGIIKLHNYKNSQQKVQGVEVILSFPLVKFS